jgi:hypothetical protein
MHRRLWLALLLAVLVFGGIVGLFLSHTSAQQARSVHLAQGWNLVSWTGANQSISGALAGVSDAVSAVYGYNGDSQSFGRYIVGRPEVSTLADFEIDRAYWLLAVRATDWSVPSSAGPSCPATTPCPAATPCPSCPAPTQLSEVCTFGKVQIELDTIWLEIAEEGQLVGRTAAEVRAELQQHQQAFDQGCQGVALLEPTLVTNRCAEVGRWKGLMEGHILYAPDAQKQVWLNQFNSIMYEYCIP